MIFKDEYDNSILTRWFFITVIFAVILVSALLMFADDWVEDGWMASYKINGDFTRQVILMICLFIYFLRLLLTVFVFLKRKMGWAETIIVSILMSLALFSFAKVAALRSDPGRWRAGAALDPRCGWPGRARAAVASGRQAQTSPADQGDNARPAR